MGMEKSCSFLNTDLEISRFFLCRKFVKCKCKSEIFLLFFRSLKHVTNNLYARRVVGLVYLALQQQIITRW
jgi:hypothetical protein